MKRLVYILFIFVLFAFGLGSVFEYGKSAKEVSLGGASVSVPINGYNAFNNPAFLASINSSQYGLSYFSMSQDRNLNAFSFSRKISPDAGIALSFFMASVNDIEQTNLDNDVIGSLDYFEGTGSMSFALKRDKISIGANLNIYQNTLHTVNADAVGIDLGFSYQLNENINFGLTSKNIGAEYKWDSGHSEKIENISEFGLSYLYKDKITFMCQMDRFGVEYDLGSIMTDNAFLRIGISNGPNFGFSYPFNLGNDLILSFDYAVDLGSENEGVSHLFSFSTLTFR